ncbi:MAG: hypothetical protein KAS32_16645 [Candidatus Peribacteraceae bacterium]|nr:hypothetical protein [Candidatus Peribacteraceae bacterium]
MKKIPCILTIDHKSHRTFELPNLGCLWVFEGEGIATRKYDGTCCAVIDGTIYKRRAVKPKHAVLTYPDFFKPCDVDPNTGIVYGWVPITKQDKWHLKASSIHTPLVHGTYELIGPKINGNPEKVDHHVLIKHTDAEVYNVPRNTSELKWWLAQMDIEGLVFKHPDGRMAKVRKKDFGLTR